MIVKEVQRMLSEKSKRHQADLARLGQQALYEPLSHNVLLLEPTPQIRAMDTILRNAVTDDVDFLFYFDRLSALLIVRYTSLSFRYAQTSADSLIELWTIYRCSQNRSLLLEATLTRVLRPPALSQQQSSFALAHLLRPDCGASFLIVLSGTC